VSVFPHAIAQAAAFDVDLVQRLLAATLLESRTLNSLIYNVSNGTVWTGTSCDGGMLANTAHDARWGRIAECYGEDPTLAATVGVAATRALQNRTADRRWLGAQNL
jgi:beta-glucosidase